MRKTSVSLVSLGLLLSALILVPTPATAFVPSTPLAGLFLTKNDTGAVALAFSPPIDQDAEAITARVAKSPQDPAPALVCARAPVEEAPAPLCGSAVLGSIIAPASFQVAGDGGLQVWLSTNLPRMPIRDVIVRLEHVNATGALSTVYGFDYASSGTTGTQVAPREQEGIANLVPWLDGTPRRIALGDLRTTVFNVTGGDTLRLVLDAVMTPASGIDQAQVRVHFGAAMPSGAVFPILGADAWRIQLGTASLALRLRDDNVTVYPLDNETDQVRVFPASQVGPVVQPALSESSRLRWGPTPLDEATRIVGTSLAEFWIQTAATTGANPQIAIDVTLSIGDHEFAGVTNTAVDLAQSAGLQKVVVPVKTTPTDVVAGMNVTIDIELYGVNATKFSIVYGSVNHTSGILLPVFGGGLVRPIVLTDPLPFLPGPATTQPETAQQPADPDEPAAPVDPEADDGENGEIADEEGTSEQSDDSGARLKEQEPQGRSPGPGLGLLLAVLLVSALLLQRGRAGKPS